MRVPLINLTLQYASIRDEVTQAIQAVCDAQQFILGPQVRRLEETVANLTAAGHAIGVSSGTDALLVSLMALGIGPGDEVATSPYTFVATAGSISRLGATPVFVDIDPATCNLDPQRLADAVKTRRGTGKGKQVLKAVIPVHLFGRCAEMAPILATAERAGLPVVEDAAQALGATYQSKPAGSFGAAGCFSFFPTKNVGAFGDGGMVVTSDAKLAERVRLLRTHGSASKDDHRVLGGNFRLDELQAAILLVKLKQLSRWNEARRRHAAAYEALFREHGLLERITPPPAAEGTACIYHQYVIRAPKRDALRAFLAEREIGTEVYYARPLHLQACYKALGHTRGSFPESERAANETLALPIFPELTEEQQAHVAETIKAFYEQG